MRTTYIALMRAGCTRFIVNGLFQFETFRGFKCQFPSWNPLVIGTDNQHSTVFR